MFRLAHITDLHIPPLPPVRASQLMGKRFTGWLNWWMGRHRAHNLAILNTLVVDLHARNPDHIACTGDITNLGLPAEWPVARDFLEKLGSPDQVSFIPGNHDAYIEGALTGLLACCKPYLLGDGKSELSFPYVRRRKNLALVGLSSAIPTMPLKAYGRLGEEQIGKLEVILEDLGRNPELCRVVMIHHPPYSGSTSPSRELKDADALLRVLARTGAELVLYGHNHVASLATIDGPSQKTIPVIAASSASSNKTDIRHRAGYHLYNIDWFQETLTIEVERYCLLAEGSVHRTETRHLLPMTNASEMFGTQE